jgi:formimidoylglutamate deiminase
LAIHSLRAAHLESIRELLDRAGADAWPIHLHIAEQCAEVDDCLAFTGERPIEYLCHQVAPDARWHLVHATHAMSWEIEQLAQTGAGIVICPGTEGNLGDGLADVAAWLAADVPIAIGSDSQVVRNWPEELRWLEYGQRLIHRQRNVAASPEHQPATAARLFDVALSAGAACAGQPLWGLVAGARADALVLDTCAPALLGIPPSHQLDALVFAGAEPVFREVLVAGEVLLRDGRHVREQAIAARFALAMEALWDHFTPAI